MTTHEVGYLIGSLAKGSIDRKLAQGAGATGSAGNRDVGDLLQGSNDTPSGCDGLL
jgi:hypothetical protein